MDRAAPLERLPSLLGHKGIAGGTQLAGTVTEAVVAVHLTQPQAGDVVFVIQ